MGLEVSFDRMASYYAENVIPTIRKLPSSSARDRVLAGVFNPDIISLQAVTGGFNCVVQISAAMALRIFVSQVTLSETTVSVFSSDLRAFIEGQEEPFEGATTLRNLVVRDDFVAGRLPRYALMVRFVPFKLAFQDPKRVCVTYEGILTLKEMSMELSAPGGPPDPNLIERRPPMPDRVIGTVLLEMCCNYFLQQDPSGKAAEVFADVANLQVTVTPLGKDATSVWTTFMSEAEFGLRAQVARWLRVYLTPQISLLGQQTGGYPLTEFPEFEARAFHVSDGNQAMAVAFDVMPGCRGIVEEVSHFVGPYDFGVISDEFVTEQVFKYQWRLGKFKRSITFEAPVTASVQRNGQQQDEDALVRGTYSLDTLNLVAMDTFSDIREDGIRIGGDGTMTPQSLRLTDGTVLKPDQVDLGPPEPHPWGVNVIPQLSAPPHADPQIREFLKSVTRDGLTQVALPFVSSQSGLSASILYTRLEAIPKRLFFLGDFKFPFT